MNILSSCYHPKETENKWYKFWEENDYFKAKVNPSKKPFCIVIPPPNVTGILHMGHALNNTIQDILIRYHRMKGYETLWMPGTDHAGIATQNVVERQLAKEGLKRQDLGREKFLERVWQWKEEYGSTIIKQLKRLGASCDWSRTRFTMDKEYSEAVKEVFVRLYEKGLIYRGDYIINWCPRCQTALSDEEAPHKEIDGFLYYIRYPLKSTNDESSVKTYIVVATTRPETMLGDTAVAVHPKDRRYKKYIGKTAILPLLNRQLMIISDSVVDKKFGTGAVKVTPAHDAVDYELGKRHTLEFINIMEPSGILNENAGPYKGLDRFKAREKIVEDLKNQGLLEKIEPYKLSVGHCYRCNTIIEPYLSTQWFVKMKPLAESAIKVVKEGRIKFHPKRWTKVYLNWMQNIKDWCISRQIWWGHRIPVYYCDVCLKNTNNQKGIIVSRKQPEKCPYCGNINLRQDEDVLDTWFSSWLWPFATFYWPKQSEDLKYFYPTSVLVTAPEIIFFWVARMIMAGLEFMGEIPFRDVYIHGTVRDIEGRKMSKSLGNIIDPLDIIDNLGADALRFSLILITASGQDVYLSEEKFKTGRNFANKIWNAARFILINLEPKNINSDFHTTLKKENLSLVNRWILSRFYYTLERVNKCLDNFRFNEAENILYNFFWHEFCDWYIEIIKPQVKIPQNQWVLFEILENFLKILHPFMPFITEEIWQRLHSLSSSQSSSACLRSIMIQSWPCFERKLIDKRAEESMEIIMEIIKSIRSIRKELEIPPEKELNIVISCISKIKMDILKEMSDCIETLSKVRINEISSEFKRYHSTVTRIVKDIKITILLEGVIDLEKEIKKIEQEIQELTRLINLKQNNLTKKDFLTQAPPEVVEKEKNKLQELKLNLEQLKQLKDEIIS